jgi:hypothetical protein
MPKERSTTRWQKAAKVEAGDLVEGKVKPRESAKALAIAKARAKLTTAPNRTAA